MSGALLNPPSPLYTLVCEYHCLLCAADAKGVDSCNFHAPTSQLFACDHLPSCSEQILNAGKTAARAGRPLVTHRLAMTKRKDVKFQHRSLNGNGLRKIRSGSDSGLSLGDGTTDQNNTVCSNTAAIERLRPLWSTDADCPLPQIQLPPEPSDYEKKKQSIITRTIWTFIMIAGFFGAILAGHIWMILIVTAIQIISFKEVIAISNVPSRARSLRRTKTLNWYFLGTTMYFLYGESVVYYFKHIVLVDRVLLPFATHHRFISFMLYVIGQSRSRHI